MFIYKFNDFTCKYYTYDLDNHDYFSQMFEETLHECKDLEWCDREITVCKFCETDFSTHKALLHHLAYHNFDVRGRIPSGSGKQHSELGDHGMINLRKQSLKKQNKKIKKLENMMRLIDIKKK